MSSPSGISWKSMGQLVKGTVYAIDHYRSIVVSFLIINLETWVKSYLVLANAVATSHRMVSKSNYFNLIYSILVNMDKYFTNIIIFFVVLFVLTGLLFYTKTTKEIFF